MKRGLKDRKKAAGYCDIGSPLYTLKCESAGGGKRKVEGS